MNWQAVSAIAATLCGVGTLLNWALTVRISLEIERLRAHITEARMHDREEMREWINGSFLRGSVVEAKMDSVSRRLTDLQQAGCSRRAECSE